ncbi:MAG: O-antigen ligase family protein, partial [Actinomycetota bacterium]
RGRASRRTVAAALALLGLLAAAVIVRSGGPAGAVSAMRAGFTGSVDQTGVRIGLGANLRDHWWGTAWDGFTAAPLLGHGAGTFRLLEQTTQEPAYTTDSAHNTVLEVLAGTGLVGGIPFLLGSAALFALALKALRRTPADDAVGTTVAIIAAIAFFAQGLVDVDWDLAAQGVIAFAAIGAVSRACAFGSERPAPTRVVAGVGATILLAAGLFALPLWLSAQQSEKSSRILLDDPQGALELATSAHRYNPLAVEPLLAEADAREILGDRGGAQAALLRSIDREPANFEAWLYYGTYLAYSWGEPEMGRVALERALDLSGGDPSVLSVYESLPPP